MPAAAWFWSVTSGMVTGIAVLWLGMTAIEETRPVRTETRVGVVALVLFCFLRNFST